jgi:hypothetical protein
MKLSSNIVCSIYIQNCRGRIRCLLRTRPSSTFSLKVSVILIRVSLSLIFGPPLSLNSVSRNHGTSEVVTLIVTSNVITTVSFTTVVVFFPGKDLSH